MREFRIGRSAVRGRRRDILHALAVATALAGPGVHWATADGFFLAYDRVIVRFGDSRIDEHFNDNNTSQATGSLSVPGASASISGNLYHENGGSFSFSATSAAVANANDVIFSSQMEIGLNSFAFYPNRAGKLGEIKATGGGSNAAMSIRNGGFAVPVDGSVTLGLFPRQVIIQAGGGIQTIFNSAYSLSLAGSVSFEFDPSISRRIHWIANDHTELTPPPVSTALAGNWLETLAPNPDLVAVFGKVPLNPSAQNPKLTGIATWRGVVSDGGSSPQVELEGNTLTLKKASLVEDDFSVSIGEENFGNSSLYFHNGTVNADSNILVQTRTAAQAQGTSAGFGVQANTTVNAEGIVSVSKFAGTTGVVAVVGNNAKLNALGMIIGVNGGGVAFIEKGGQVTLEQNFEVAQGPLGNNAQVQVVGANSSLTVGGPNLGATAVSIGDVAKGSLAIHDGAKVDFNSSQVDIGNAIAASGSIISVKGTNSQLLGGTYNVGTAATLEILDNAKLLSNPASGISVTNKGIFTADNNATVTVGNLFVSGPQALGVVAHGSTVTVSSEVRIGENATLTVASGSTLTGFDIAGINGLLQIGPGAVVTGDRVALGGGGKIVIGGGFMQVTTVQGDLGTITADANAFIETTPEPPDPGGAALTASALRISSLEATPPPTSPQGAAINITGNVLLGSGVTIELDIFSPTDFDSFNVTGNLSLAGTLLLNFPTYAPQTGDTFTLLNLNNTPTGLTPASLALTGLEPGWQYQTNITPTGLQITALSNAVLAVPEPGTAIGLLSAVPLLRRRH